MSGDPYELWRLQIDLKPFERARRAAARLTELEVLETRTTALSERPDGSGRIEAWIVEPPTAEAVALALDLPADEAAANLVIERVPALNWVALSQAALPPVVAGRFVVHGSHDRARVGWRRDAIEIDAGEAFGTAHHATTSGCLLAIDRITRAGRAPRTVLDLGCGAGTLAIAAARVWPMAAVWASDNDPVAIAVATANARRNRVGAQVRTLCAQGLAHPELRRARPFDLLLANILAEPLIRMCGRITTAVRPGGRVVLSGLLATQVREVRNHYQAHGMAHAATWTAHGWSVLELVRRSGRSG